MKFLLPLVSYPLFNSENPLFESNNGILPAYDQNQFLMNSFSYTRQDFECGICKWGSFALRELIEVFRVKDQLLLLGRIGCPMFISKLSHFSSSVCNGVINQQVRDYFLPILLEKLTSQHNLCTYQFEVCDMEGYKKRNMKEEIFEMLAHKPEAAKSNDYVNKMYKANKHKTGEPVKIVSISDLHIDYEYMTGASNNCGKILCCRSDSGKPLKQEEAAGKWGDFNCDLNSVALDSMLTHIKNEIKPDFVLWGGDSIPHDISTLKVSSNIATMKRVTKQMKEGLGNIKIYPTIGNHDTYPMNNFKMNSPLT